LKGIQISARYVADSGDLRSWVADATADAVFVIDTEYMMTPYFDGLMICVRVSLCAHKPTLAANVSPKNDLPAVLYYNLFSTVIYPSRPPGKAKVSPEEWIGLWITDQGRPLREALDKGWDEISKMIVFDLNQPGTADSALYKVPKGGLTKTALTPQERTPAADVEGYIVHLDGQRVWLRMPAGQLVSTSK
jgi:hypothetical protein